MAPLASGVVYVGGGTYGVGAYVGDVPMAVKRATFRMMYAIVPTVERPPVTIPPIASPSPPSVPPDREMSRLLIAPRTIAGIPVRIPRQQMRLVRPRTSEMIALLSVCCGGEYTGAGIICGCGWWGG